MCANEDPKTNTLNDAKLDDVNGGFIPTVAGLEKDDDESGKKKRPGDTKDNWIVIPPIK